MTALRSVALTALAALGSLALGCAATDAEDGACASGGAEGVETTSSELTGRAALNRARRAYMIAHERGFNPGTINDAYTGGEWCFYVRIQSRDKAQNYRDALEREFKPGADWHFSRVDRYQTDSKYMFCAH